MVNEGRQTRVPNWQRQAWLTEYQVCQQDINSRASRYWTIVGVFMAINTALLGWVAFSIISNGVSLNESVKWLVYINENFNWLVLVLVLGFGIIAILVFLMLWLKRVNCLIHISYYRMREIEFELRMAKNWIVDVLDNKWDNLSTKEKGRLANLHKDHIGPIETKVVL